MIKKTPIKKKPVPKIDIGELRKSLISLSKTVKIKQDEKVILSHLGISHNNQCKTNMRGGDIHGFKC